MGSGHCIDSPMNKHTQTIMLELCKIRMIIRLHDFLLLFQCKMGIQYFSLERSVLENIVPDSSGGFGIPGHVPIQRVGVEGFPCGFRKIVECGIN